jgi:hypothetical protein
VVFFFFQTDFYEPFFSLGLLGEKTSRLLLITFFFFLWYWGLKSEFTP